MENPEAALLPGMSAIWRFSRLRDGRNGGGSGCKCQSTLTAILLLFEMTGLPHCFALNGGGGFECGWWSSLVQFWLNLHNSESGSECRERPADRNFTANAGGEAMHQSPLMLPAAL